MRESKNGTLDIVLIATVVLLMGIGIGFLYSASQPVSVRYYGTPYFIVMKQLFYMGFGVIAFFIGAIVPHEFYEKKIKLIVLAMLLLLIVILIPGVAKEVMGARRWLTFGKLSIQPSELAKCVVVLYLSSVLSNKKEVIYDFYKGVFPPLALVALIAFFVFLENDFSTTFLILMVVFVIFFVANVRIVTLFMMLLIGVASSGIMIVLAPYRVKRMFAFINPWNDPLDSGWHYIQSMKCFSIGKWFGSGIGESSQKIMALPEAHNDYIFAIIAEEGGAMMSIFVIALFLAAALIGLHIALKQEKRYSMLLAAGITVLIFVQAMMNVGVVIGILPATGITLPFISSGGTSVVVFLFTIGVLFNISKTGSRSDA